MKKIAFFVMGMCASLMMWNCKGGTSNEQGLQDGDSVTTENLLKVGESTIVKFVRVVNDNGTRVFSKADEGSPWRVTWIEDLESDMADIQERWSNEKVPEDYLCNEDVACAGDVLAVLGEEGDFYKVTIRNEYSDMEFGFVKKDDCVDVEPEKLTVAALKELTQEYNWIHVRVITEGQYKGLVLLANLDELKGERFEVGVMMDGYMAFPEMSGDFIDYSSEVNELTFSEVPETGGCPTYFVYPKSMAHLSEYDYSEGFDPDKLTDEQIGRILKDMQKRKSEYVKYEYLIPMTEGGVRAYWVKNAVAF